MIVVIVALAAATLVPWGTPAASSAISPRSVPAQAWAEPHDPDDLIDDDLLRAVRRLGLVDWWAETAQTDKSIAFLRVLDSTDLAVRRGELIALGELVVRHQTEITVAGVGLQTARRAAVGLDNDLRAVEDRLAGLVRQRDARRETIASLRGTGHPAGSVDAVLHRRGASVDEAAVLERVIERVEAAQELASAEVDRVDAVIASAEKAIDDLVEARRDNRDRARLVGEELIELRAERIVPGPNLVLVALDAYLAGAEHGASCGIDWAILAGIGWIESQHGTYHGAYLQSDGTLSDPILGIRLDGSRSARIADSDGGRLDGDTSFDRAVGPMQFIPSTWTRHGVDGDGDGTIDPQDLHDAAATAAAYLCRVGSASTSLHDRLLGYNNSNAYVGDVQRNAASLRDITFPQFD